MQKTETQTVSYGPNDKTTGGFVGLVTIKEKTMIGTLSKGDRDIVVQIYDYREAVKLRREIFPSESDESLRCGFLDDVVVILSRTLSLNNALLSASYFRKRYRAGAIKDLSPYRGCVALVAADCVLHSPIPYEVAPFPKFKMRPQDYTSLVAD